MKQLLNVENLEVCYEKKPVVRDVSFQVQPGEILGIVGESGSGKSTVLRAVMGLLGEGGSVTGGTIVCQGQTMTGIEGEALRKLRGPVLGMIFQNVGAALCPIRTIEDQLYESVMEHENVSRAEVKERALELLEKMRLSDGKRILQSYPFELSGGMNQRVGIMMAMVLKPALLLADEPTSALDVTVQAQVIQEMMQMQKLHGMGMVIVTHNIGVVERMADKVAVMHQGHLVEYGTREEVLYHPQELYTKRLISAVLRLHRG